MSTVDQGALAVGQVRRLSPRGAITAVRRNALVPGIPLFVVLTLIILGVFAPLVAPFDPNKQSLKDSNLPPAWTATGESKFLLGTDRFGRDQLSRIIFGARISLEIAASCIAIGAAFGTLIGLCTGYFGGKVDIIFMRLADIVMAYPTLLLAIVLATVLGPSFQNVIVVVSLTMWPRFARLVRSEALGVKPNDFVTYARNTGTSTPRILLKHIFPNVVPTLLVLVTWEVGAVILIESSLSFLGAGIPPPNPSWGTMVLDGRGMLETAWWISLFPGLAILLTVLSLNLLGDWLRDWLDPKLRKV